MNDEYRFEDYGIEAALASMEQSNKLAQELMAKDPKLPYVSAVVIAGDLISADRARVAIQAGKEFLLAIWMAGSYARLDVAVWARERGYVEDEQLFKLLPALWSGSDPDDTDPRFLDLWLDAWRWNGSKTIRDGRALPRGKWLDLYRGQDQPRPGEVPGIAWSLDRDVAERFANGAATRQSNRGGVVLHTRVRRSDALAFLTGRHESEVIINTRGETR